MLNECKVTVSGNVTRDPEMRISKQSGRPFTVVPVAVNTRKFDKDSNTWVTTDTVFFDLACYGQQGANVLETIAKGHPVVAHGRMRLYEWTSETASGQRLTLDVDTIGLDLSFGTAAYAKGKAKYPLDRVQQDLTGTVPPPEEGGPAVDPATGLTHEDGMAYDEHGEVHEAPGDVDLGDGERVELEASAA